MTNQGKYINYTEKSITDLGLKNSSAWVVPMNSIILSMYASYGIVSINKIPLATSQAMYNMIIKENYNIEYIYQYFNYLKYSNYYDSLISTGTQANLNAEKVNKLPIYIPQIEEQNKVGNIFQLLDKKIELQLTTLNKLHELKKGLMQNMFV